MNRDEFEQMTNEIGALEDPAQMRTKLAELKDKVIGVYDERDSLSKEKENFKADNEKLRQANMDLFLRVGGKKPESADDSQQKQTPQKRSYDDLFDKEGGLKIYG